MYGFYSKKQARLVKIIATWAREDGTEVLCTEVSSTPEAPSVWEDLEHLGPVVKWIRSRETLFYIPEPPLIKSFERHDRN